MARSEQPVFASTKRTFSQVVPPSVVRKTPRSGLSFQRAPVAQTKTFFPFFGFTATRAIRSVFSRPSDSHVSPPSEVRKTPAPTETLFRTADSPVPTQTVLGSEGSTVSAPTDWGSPSKTGLKVRPPLSDFQTPPA